MYLMLEILADFPLHGFMSTNFVKHFTERAEISTTRRSNPKISMPKLLSSDR
jgi:hypothetical protein